MGLTSTERLTVREGARDSTSFHAFGIPPFSVVLLLTAPESHHPPAALKLQPRAATGSTGPPPTQLPEYSPSPSTKTLTILAAITMADSESCVRPFVQCTRADKAKRRHHRQLQRRKCRQRPQLKTAVPLTRCRASAVTPINLILLSLFGFLVYLRLRPAKLQTLPKAPPPTVFRTFTPPELFPYNGLNGMPVYLAVRGRVFDVTSGRNFYGPGGPYANFAGRDASRGLAHGSFDEDMLTKDLDGPLDTLADLNDEQLEALRGWEERFSEKYLVVGKLVHVGSDEAQKAAAQK